MPADLLSDIAEITIRAMLALAGGAVGLMLVICLKDLAGVLVRLVRGEEL